MKNIILFIGTYNAPLTNGDGEVFTGKGEGLYSIAFDPESGSFGPRLDCLDTPNVSHMAVLPDARQIYAVNEMDHDGSLLTFLRYGEDGILSQEGSVALHSSAACHLEYTGERAYISNYLSGSLSVVGDRQLLQMVQHQGCSVDPVRQEGPHVHSSMLYNGGGNLLVADLGLDCLVSYPVDRSSGLLGQAVSYPVRAGSGPRSIIKDRDGGRIYVSHELDRTVSVWEADGPKLREVQQISVFDDGRDLPGTTAELALDPSGSRLYVTTRGCDMITVFAVGPAGKPLERMQTVSAMGHNPRSFCLAPDSPWLIVANQDSDELVCFRADEDGSLSYHGRTSVRTPVCVRAAALRS